MVEKRDAGYLLSENHCFIRPIWRSCQLQAYIGSRSSIMTRGDDGSACVRRIGIGTAATSLRYYSLPLLSIDLTRFVLIASLISSSLVAVHRLFVFAFNTGSIQQASYDKDIASLKFWVEVLGTLTTVGTKSRTVSRVVTST